MFIHIVKSGCYIYINVSEIPSDNCGKYVTHAQNIILTLTGLGFFDMLRFGGHLPPSNFVVTEPIKTKFCTAVEHPSVSLNVTKIYIELMTS